MKLNFDSVDPELVLALLVVGVLGGLAILQPDVQSKTLGGVALGAIGGWLSRGQAKPPGGGAAA